MAKFLQRARVHVKLARERVVKGRKRNTAALLGRARFVPQKEWPEQTVQLRQAIVRFLSEEGTQSSAVRLLANKMARQRRNNWVHEGTGHERVLLVTGNDTMDIKLAFNIRRLEDLRQKIKEALKEPEHFGRTHVEEQLANFEARQKKAQPFREEFAVVRKGLADDLNKYLLMHPVGKPEKKK
ncbi:MAG TPA: hypothetical protein VI977_02575 [archaeon]|nr:hypothetical protein [archaeon]